MIAAIFIIGVFAIGGSLSEDRVVGGRFAKEGEIPYIVSIRENVNGQWSVICGGSVIGPRHIVSAAHCFKAKAAQPWNFRIQYDQLDKFSPYNLIDIESIKNHEDYVGGSGQRPYDIAVLKLRDELPLGMGRNVEMVNLPNGPANIPGDSVQSTLAGWGQDQNAAKVRYLKVAEIPLFNDQKCRQYLGGMYNQTHHVCAGDLDGSNKHCSGDSGGPLVANGELHGVVSWSVKPCTIRDRPGIFAKVSQYVPWIRKQMREM